jgi:hypothetical protein
MVNLVASRLLPVLLAVVTCVPTTAKGEADVSHPDSGATVASQQTAAPPIADRLKPIGEVHLPVAGDAHKPRDLAEERFSAELHLLHVTGISRPWGTIMRTWAAPGLCHRPLYFEEEWLERYGYSYGIAQPAASAVNLGGRVIALPALIIAAPPHECIYTLGRGRPGNCNIGPCKPPAAAPST